MIEQLQTLLRLTAPLHAPAAGVRVRSDLAAAAFHLGRQASDRPIVAIVGGTGTGKSTLVNRLLGADVTATSFRRTFTAGPVAIAREGLPEDFASLPHVVAEALPARGEADRVVVVRHPIDFVLIDTPDLDGELPEHHQLADRIFRWADAVVFLVTPEKYQMTELQPYYRLVERYTLPRLFVMNKADDDAVVDDYAQLLARSGIANPDVLGLPRDDSGWQPAANRKLEMANVASLRVATTSAGLDARVRDASQRLNDQVLQPLLETRRAVDRTIAAVHTLGGAAVDVDVHPMTQQLQRRLREKSVLYLIGPQRILDRVRQVPMAIVRLPRTMWDWTRTGEFKLGGADQAGRSNEPPDFKGVLVEQFQSLQSRIDDLMRQSGAIPADASWKLPTDEAGTIAEEELAALRQWLETRWNATPRDTAVLRRLLKVIPGAEKLTKYSEAAPYLLTIACVAHGAGSVAIGHLDLIVLGGYSAVTWLTERLSNEVSARTRATNRAMAERYQQLTARQVDAAITWLDQQAPAARDLEKIAAELDRLRSLG